MSSRHPAGAAATGDADVERLQALLAALPAPFEAPDVCALDGLLCSVLLQPEPIAPELWRPYVTDLSGRSLPRGVAPAQLFAIVERRWRELDLAIAGRRWFDPWVFELPPPATAAECVQPWIAGFLLGLERFDRLLALDDARLREPLAVLYRHLDPADLELDREVLELIDSLEPPAKLADSVEDLVCAVLLLADVTRPQAAAGLASAPASRRGVRGAAGGRQRPVGAQHRPVKRQ